MAMEFKVVPRIEGITYVFEDYFWKLYFDKYNKFASISEGLYSMWNAEHDEKRDGNYDDYIRSKMDEWFENHVNDSRMRLYAGEDLEIIGTVPFLSKSRISFFIRPKEES